MQEKLAEANATSQRWQADTHNARQAEQAARKHADALQSRYEAEIKIFEGRIEDRDQIIRDLKSEVLQLRQQDSTRLESLVAAVVGLESTLMANGAKPSQKQKKTRSPAKN